jgi:hypothetical protein
MAKEVIIMAKEVIIMAKENKFYGNDEDDAISEFVVSFVFNFFRSK